MELVTTTTNTIREISIIKTVILTLLLVLLWVLDLPKHLVEEMVGNTILTTQTLALAIVLLVPTIMDGKVVKEMDGLCLVLELVL
jgi:hypothetical protein